MPQGNQWQPGDTEQRRQDCQARILAHLKEYPDSWFTVKELWRVLGGASELFFRDRLKYMEEEGMVTRDQQARGSSGNTTTRWRIASCGTTARSGS